MTYKGYTGVLEVDEDAGELSGIVLGLRDVVTFVGATVEDARRSFEESVDAYLRSCAETGKDPDRPFSGRLLIRIPSEMHRGLAVVAQSHKVSLNDAVVEALGDFLEANRAGALEAELNLEEATRGGPRRVASHSRRRQA